MNIGIIGYGKMGKTIEEVARERGHHITSRLTSASTAQDWQTLKDAHVSIEFTRPEAALENYARAMELGIRLVTGTTGWYDRMEHVKAVVDKHDGSFFWASNFSIGVHLFWKANRQLAKIMAEHQDYKVKMREIHHTQKLDEPSGTAITTAQQILAERSDLKHWRLADDKPGPTDLPIEAIREGDVKGTHIVTYESEIDSIQLKHAAKNRKGFALGSVLAAEFLLDKKGFYSMDDLLT